MIAILEYCDPKEFRNTRAGLFTTVILAKKLQHLGRQGPFLPKVQYFGKLTQVSWSGSHEFHFLSLNPSGNVFRHEHNAERHWYNRKEALKLRFRQSWFSVCWLLYLGGSWLFTTVRSIPMYMPAKSEVYWISNSGMHSYSLNIVLATLMKWNKHLSLFNSISLRALPSWVRGSCEPCSG